MENKLKDGCLQLVLIEFDFFTLDSATVLCIYELVLSEPITLFRPLYTPLSFNFPDLFLCLLIGDSSNCI